MDIVSCKDCGHESCGNRGKNYRLVCCSYKSTPKTATNADRIRDMTDEELAEFIGRDPMHDICPNNCQNDLDRPCKMCVLDWLRQEAKSP